MMTTFASAFLAMLLTFGGLRPENSTQFFVEPDSPAQMVFWAEDANPENPVPFEISDVDGNPRVGADLPVQVETVDGRTRYFVQISLPAGYFELSAGDQTFGIVSQKSFCSPTDDLQALADPYFAIDGALSWLVAGEKMGRREDLVKIAQRSGIGMIRERLSWNEVEREPGNIDFESGRHYDSLRQTCSNHGIKVLELFHDAPTWMQKTDKYPAEFGIVYSTFSKLSQKWSKNWGGLEVWNEPEIMFGGNLPADQYIPVLKTIAYQQARANVEERTEIGGGVVAHFHPDWLRCAAENGMLDHCTFFSFHTYSTAPNMENLSQMFQGWLDENGQSAKPVWVTECGRPWKIGPGRPPREQDLASAIDIVMKGVEFRAVGFTRYFPFVFPYYEERDSNFGMMSRDGTPLRSFAAYARLVSVLSHREFLGDLACPADSDWIRARVFANDPSSVIVVLYAQQDGQKPLTWNAPDGTKILKAERITGENLGIDQNQVLSPDGFAYVWMSRENLEEKILTDSLASQIRRRRAAGTQYAKPAQDVSPIIVHYRPDLEHVMWTPSGYTFPQFCGEEIPLTLTVTNLGESSETLPITWPAEFRGPKTVTVPAGECVTLDATAVFSAEKVDWKGGFQNLQVVVGKEVLNLSMRAEATFAQKIAAAGNPVRLDIRDVNGWKHSAAGCCDVLEFLKTGDAWGFRCHFTEGDRWAYPIFALPEGTDLSEFSGILVRGRSWDVQKKTDIRLFFFQPQNSYFTPNSLFPADGEWHDTFIPFSALQYCPSAGGDSSKALDLGSVHGISFGLNTKNDAVQLEISDVFLCK